MTLLVEWCRSYPRIPLDACALRLHSCTAAEPIRFNKKKQKKISGTFLKWHPSCARRIIFYYTTPWNVMMSGGRPEFNRATRTTEGFLVFCLFLWFSQSTLIGSTSCYIGQLCWIREITWVRITALWRTTNAAGGCWRSAVHEVDTQTFSKAQPSSSRFHQICVRRVKAAFQFCSAVHCQATPTSCVLSTVDSWHRKADEFPR